MKHTLSMIRKVLAKFWSRQPKVDYLELHYGLLDTIVSDLNEEELGRLMAQRDILRKRKKKWSHIQQQIEQLKARMILDEMRAK